MTAPVPAVGVDAPAYDRGSLADVLPSVLAGLGVPVPPAILRDSAFPMPPARRAVVVLVDGLGYDLLRRRSGHAPFLRSLLPTGHRVAAGFPSTTATSMGTFGTGLHPGEHGMLGYEVLDPDRGVLLNELSWEDGPVPEQWQRAQTVFEVAARDGVAVTRIGPGYFDGSGLTRAALRGGRFVAAESLAARVDAAVAAASSAARTLTYLYWGEVDKVGHVLGCASWEWGEELESVDRELGRLASALPADTSLTITADHGMIDIPHALRVDLAHDAELARGIRVMAGEPRSPQLHCVPGAVADVAATWRARLGDRAWVLTRDEAAAAGWFGGWDPTFAGRAGDLVVAMRDQFAVVDSRRMRPELLALRGLHGSLSDDEVAVPVLHLPPRTSH